VIVVGAVLAPGKRTITACLCMTGRTDAGDFASYHQLLNRAQWRSAAMTRRLLSLIIDRLVPDGPLVIGVDDTIERRWAAGSRHAASIVIRSDLATAILSKPPRSRNSTSFTCSSLMTCPMFKRARPKRAFSSSSSAPATNVAPC